jgi:hypothetical protein
MTELTLPGGGILRAGDHFWVIGEDGFAELVGPVVIEPPIGYGWPPTLAVGNASYAVSQAHLSREAAIGAAIRGEEAGSTLLRRKLEECEKRLKALYRQRDEMAEWKGQWAGTEA